MVIQQVNSSYHINFPFSKRMVDAVKALPGRYWNSALKVWVIPATEESEPIVKEFAAKYRFKWDNAVEEARTKYAIPPMPELTVDIPLKMKLFPYQQKGVAYALQKQRLIIGDQPGLGKTGQAIATILAANQFPCLIICPSSLKINWQREWEKWTNKKARVIDPAIARYMDRWIDAGMIDVFIVNYESLKKYFVSEITCGEDENLTLKHVIFNKKKDLFKSVIIDESHRCKDFGSQQTKFTRGICRDKEWVLCLTGTPVVNKPKDLMPQLGIISRIGDFGGDKFFRDRYCGGIKGASNLSELNYKLNTICFFQRQKSEVLTDLPAKMRQVLLCELDATHRAEYQKAEDDLREYLIKYKEATDEKIEKSLKGEVMVRIGILKNISARGKLNDVRDFIRDTIEGGEKLVVFLHLKEVFQKLKTMFPDALSIVGDNTMNERQAAVDAFQNDPSKKLILCSMQAAGIGLTLTASSRVGFVEQGWHPAIHDQCEDRCHRIGQYDSVQCTYWLGKDTIDEWVYDIIQEKRKITSEITGSADDVEVDIVDKVANLFNIKKEEKAA